MHLENLVVDVHCSCARARLVGKHEDHHVRPLAPSSSFFELYILGMLVIEQQYLSRVTSLSARCPMTLEGELAKVLIIPVTAYVSLSLHAGLDLRTTRILSCSWSHETRAVLLCDSFISSQLDIMVSLLLPPWYSTGLLRAPYRKVSGPAILVG